MAIPEMSAAQKAKKFLTASLSKINRTIANARNPIKAACPTKSSFQSV